MVSFPLIAVLGPALKADISFALGSGQIMCSLHVKQHYLTNCRTVHSMLTAWDRPPNKIYRGERDAKVRVGCGRCAPGRPPKRRNVGGQGHRCQEECGGEVHRAARWRALPRGDHGESP